MFSAQKPKMFTPFLGERSWKLQTDVSVSACLPVDEGFFSFFRREIGVSQGLNIENTVKDQLFGEKQKAKKNTIRYRVDRGSYFEVQHVCTLFSESYVPKPAWTSDSELFVELSQPESACMIPGTWYHTRNTSWASQKTDKASESSSATTFASEDLKWEL